jgi:Flp pilus assembly pilin Flp
MTAILTCLRNCLKDDHGVTLIEYGIALALALLVGTAALTLLGSEIAASLGLASGMMPD